nr:hypothetical protein [Parabacteroides goldsteinii]
MPNKKVKVSELPRATTTIGLIVLGVDGNNDSCSADMELLRGNTGATPIITMKVIGLDPGSEPTVKKEGTAEAPIITIGIPKGDPGDTPVFRPGPTGIMWKYTSEPDTAYRQLVSYDDIKLRLSDLTEEDILLLQKPATDAAAASKKQDEAIKLAEEARVLKEQARDREEDARKLAEKAREDEEKARDLAEKSRDAAEKGRSDAEVLRNRAEEARKQAEQSRSLAEESRDLAEKARARAEEARVKAEESRVEAERSRQENTTAAIQRANDATAKATEVAEHSTYIGQDHYVYKWNTETKQYDKSNIYCKGDAFSIKKVYPSIAVMNNDIGNTSIKEGDFVLVNTGNVEDPDNAQLYVKTRDAVSGTYMYDFLVDMSGAIGFTGKTPQLFMGTVTTGPAGSAAAVSLSEGGTDKDGNPIYNLSFVIPQGIQGFEPLIEVGEVTSIPFGNPPEVSLRENGVTPEGRGKYLIDFSIPKGEPGAGSGNIKADVTGVIAGKTYLFQPSGDGSPEGILIEYTPEPFPEAPQDGKTYGRKNGGWSEVNSAGNMDGGTAFSVYGGSLVMNGGNSNTEI